MVVFPVSFRIRISFRLGVSFHPKAWGGGFDPAAGESLL
jgi:hypothetical protein